jgi:hypothetical protein
LELFPEAGTGIQAVGSDSQQRRAVGRQGSGKENFLFRRALQGRVGLCGIEIFLQRDHQPSQRRGKKSLEAHIVQSCLSAQVCFFFNANIRLNLPFARPDSIREAQALFHLPAGKKDLAEVGYRPSTAPPGEKTAF